jgi:archaeal flagellar protein FlaJ
MDIKKMLKVRNIPLMVSAALIILSLFFYNNIGIAGNMVMVAVIIGVVPYAFVSYFEYSGIKAMEERLPLFLLDLSEAQKIGMTLPEALKQVSKSDYGKLSSEIKKIDYQLSWGIPISEAMNNFAVRVQKSKMIGRVIRIINEAYSSGGDIARTMESTASDINAINEAEKERKSITYEHMMIMYAIYFIFIGIVIGLSQTLIPLMNMNSGSGTNVAGSSIMAFTDPCSGCENGGLNCINCSIFTVFCKMFLIEKSCYYYALFILMAVFQGIFSGLVAGQIGEGSVTAGLKHSAIMTIAGFGILMLLLKTGVI